LKAGLTHLGLGRVDDPRSDQGRKWKLKRLLEPLLTGMCADKHSLAEVETLTDDLAPAVRQGLGIFRRVPDTTMRDLLVRLQPASLVECLTRQVKRLHRQKALDPTGFPFGIVGIDVTLNEKQPTLLAEATRLLGNLPDEKKVAASEERVGGGIEKRTLFVTTEMAGFHEWSHLETVLRVRRQRWNGEGRLELDHERYFLTSLRFKAMEPDQWLRLVRRYWGSVESGIHQTLDTVYQEDDRPWIRNDDQGALNLVFLRRMAYNLVAQFRGRTQRSDDRTATPWKRVMEWVYQALICATQDVVSGLRPRLEAAGER
jgi:hypothetical protein